MDERAKLNFCVAYKLGWKIEGGRFIMPDGNWCLPYEITPWSQDIRAALDLLPKSGPVTMVRHASGEWVVGTKHYGSAMTLPEAICRWFLREAE